MFASQFENEDKSFKNRKTAIAGFTTIFIHALIILFLIFNILHTPVPPFEDNAGGMSVNYGTDQTGQGDIQPFTYNPGPTEASSSASKASSAPEESAPENVITDEKSESDVVVPKTEEKPKPKIDNKAIFKHNPKPSKAEPSVTPKASAPNPEPPQPKADANALFHKGAYGKPNNSKGDGTGGSQGDQGNPNGDPNSKNYLGEPGLGDKPGTGGLKGGYSLKGRKKITLPSPSQCGTPGKVVIGIKVDKTGKVVEATYRRFESTTYDECNKNNALNAARKATFSPDPNAPDIQEGTITYIYRID